MKNIGSPNFLPRFIAPLILAVGLAGQSAFATVTLPFYDSFTNSTGNLGPGGVDSTSWTLGASSPSIKAGAPYFLSYTNLITSASPGGLDVNYPVPLVQEDVGVQFSVVSNASSSVYVSFLLKVITPAAVASTNGRAIVELHDSASTFPNTTAKLSILLLTNNTLSINKRVQSLPSIYAGSGYTNANGLGETVALGFTTHMVVARYQVIGVNSSSTTDDTVDLWLDPDPSALGGFSAPTPTLASVGSGNADANPGIIDALIHINTNSLQITGEWYIDEFRVGTNWAQVTPSTLIPDANQSTVTASPSTLIPADGTSSSIITITAINGAGSPVTNIAANNITVAASGSGNTIVQPSSATDTNGQTTATITSTSAGNKTITVTINGITLSNQPVVQFISATANQLVWNGNVSGDWDVANTLNWQGPTNFNIGDFATFNDSATGTTNVNLTTQLIPGGLTVSNNTKNYTFSGPGYIDGAITLIKKGSGTLLISNSVPNTFSNNVVIAGGTLTIGSPNILPAYGYLTLSNVAGATFNLNGNNQTLYKLFGGGTSGGNVALGSATLTLTNGTAEFDGTISGSGSLVCYGSPTETLGGSNTYSGGTIISNNGTGSDILIVANQTGSGIGTGSIDIEGIGCYLRFGNGAYGGSVAAAVITNNGIVRFNATNDLTITNVIVGSGSVQQYGTNDTVFITSSNSYTGTNLINYGAVKVSNSAALGSAGSSIFINNDATAQLELTGNVTLPQPINVQMKSGSLGYAPSIINISGTNILAGQITLAPGGSYWIFESDSGKLTINGGGATVNTTSGGNRTLWLSGAGNGEWDDDLVDGSSNVANVRKDGAGTWTLGGTQDYSGSTVVSNGTLLVTGTLDGGTDSSNYVEVAGGFLGGIGVIDDVVTVDATGTLAPGTSSIGTLTVNSNLTLVGNVLIKVNKSLSPSNDLTMVTGALTNSGTGTVTLTNLGASAFTLGNKFTIFSKAVSNGGALTIVGVLTNNGWAWANNLAVDGSVSVVTAPAGRPVLGIGHTNSVLTFTWTNASFHLQAQTNALNVGLVTNGANWFDYPGGTTSPVNVTTYPTNPAVFFRLKSP